MGETRPEPLPVMKLPFDEAPCECCTRHVPQPAEIERHHVYPAAEQIKRYGKVIDDTRANLCPTAHTNVHHAVRRMLKGEDFRLGNRHQQRIAEEGAKRIREG